MKTKMIKTFVGGFILIGMPMYLLGVLPVLLFTIFIIGMYLFIDGFTDYE